MLHHVIKEYLKSKKGSLLVTGPPGTGKTYQLVKLIEHIIVNQKINPQNIIVFCFNRRWAKILREATAELIGCSIFEIPITTFFAYSRDVIEKVQLMDLSGTGNPGDECNVYGNKGRKEIKILNAPEQWLLLKNTIMQDVEKSSHPVTFGHVLNPNKNVAVSFIQEVFDFILRAQENLLSPGAIRELLRNEITPVLREIIDLYSCYQKVLVQENIYNYGRLLADTVDFFKSNSEIKRRIQDYYEYVIVDDLQEVNKAQYEIIKSISSDNNIFFGNDDQCTYAFRGSMLGIFNELFKALESNPGNIKNILFLNKNYRSGKDINSLNNHFIENNRLRVPKRSNAGKQKESRVTISEFKNTIEEVNFLIDRIKDLLIRKKVRPEDVLILVKGRGYKTRLLEDMLDKNHISYMQRSSRSLLDNPYVLYILNHLKLISILKPNFDKGSGLGVYRRPDGEESITSGRLFDSIVFSDFVGVNPASSLGKNDKEENIWERLRSVPPLYETVLDLMKIKNASAFEVAMKLLNDERIGVLKYLYEQKDLMEGQRSAVIGILGDFLHTIKDFAEKNPGSDSIADYLGFLEDAIGNSFLEEVEDSTKGFIRPGFINIMSFHQCRGMEFDAVFIPFINKNYLPAEFSNTQLYDIQTFNLLSEGRRFSDELLKKKHFEDERKLFYNGLTRVKRFLFISANIQEPLSIFFEEIKSIHETIRKRASIGVKQGYRKNERVKYEAGLPGMHTDHNIYLGKNWLLRKSMIARAFKYSGNGTFNKKKFHSDLKELADCYPYREWWRIRKVSKNRNAPFLRLKPVFSYSSLNTFRDCPFRYKIKHYFGVDEEENLAVLVGSIYHEVLRIFFNLPVRAYSWQNLNKIIIELFNSGRYAFEFNYLKNELFQKALRDFSNFYDYFVKDKKLVVFTEKEFNFVLDDDLIKGRIDQVSLLSDSEAELIDFKSGSKNMSKVDIQEDIQLRLYRMAVDHCSNFDFLKGKDISLRYVFIGDDKNRDPSVLLPAGVYDYRVFSKYLKSMIKKIKKEHFIADPRNTYTCSLCGFRMLCPGKDF